MIEKLLQDAKTIKRAMICGLLCGLMSYGASLVVGNRYVSVGRVLPADQRAPSLNPGNQIAAAAAAVGVSIPGQETADAAYVDILNSYWFRSSLLMTRFEFNHKKTFGISRKYNTTLCDYLGASNMDRAISKIKDDVVIGRDFKTKLITIKVQTDSPELSQKVVNRSISLLEEFILTKSKTRGGNKAVFATDRLDEARKSAELAESVLLNFIKNNKNYATSQDPAIRLYGMRLEAELKLRQQLVMTLALSLEQALMDSKNDMPILNVLDSGNYPFEKSGPWRSGWALIGLLMGVLAVGVHRAFECENLNLQSILRWLK